MFLDMMPCNMLHVYRRFEETYCLLFLSASIYQPYKRPWPILTHPSEFSILHYYLTRCYILITNAVGKLSLNALKISYITLLLFYDW